MCMNKVHKETQKNCTHIHEKKTEQKRVYKYFFYRFINAVKKVTQLCACLYRGSARARFSFFLSVLLILFLLPSSFYMHIFLYFRVFPLKIEWIFYEISWGRRRRRCRWWLHWYRTRKDVYLIIFIQKWIIFW